MRISVVRGQPTAEEVAALVAALTGASDDSERRLVPVVPAWLRAARLESAGGRVAAAPHDLDGP